MSTYSCFIPTNIFSIVIHSFFSKKVKLRYRKGGISDDTNVIDYRRTAAILIPDQQLSFITALTVV